MDEVSLEPPSGHEVVPISDLPKEAQAEQWRGEQAGSLRGTTTAESLGFSAEPTRAQAVFDAHAGLVLDMVREMSSQAKGSRREAATEAMRQEKDQVYAALRHLVRASSTSEALEMCICMEDLWLADEYDDAWRRIQDVLTLNVTAADEGAYAQVLLIAARCALRTGSLLESARLANESFLIATRLKKSKAKVEALSMLGLVALERGDYESARVDFERAVEVQDVDKKPERAEMLNNLGDVALAQGDYAGAREYLHASLGLYIDLPQQEIAQAWVLNDLAALELASGDPAHAARTAGRALEMGRHDNQLVAWAHNYLGLARAELGDLEEALTYQMASLRHVQSVGDRRGTSRAIDGLAVVAAKQGDNLRALQLFAAAKALRDAAGIPQTVAEGAVLEGTVAQARATVGEHEAEGAERAGSTMQLIQAVALGTRG